MIYLVSNFGAEGTVFEALLKISGCDPGLTALPDSEVPEVLGVSFSPKAAPSFSSGRLLEVVQSVKDVYIKGVDSSFMTMWGKPMIEYGGVTDVDITASTDECSIWLDVTEGAGIGYRSLDRNGNFIYAPLPVILFHELAHVYHGMIVDDTPGDGPRDQLLAIHDENLYRSQLGFPLRNPNVTVHDFHGPPTIGPRSLAGCKDVAFPDLCKCNIATAALGDPAARQIAEFRRTKRDFEKLTLGGEPILAPMWNAYQMFSPAVAGRMLGDPELRGMMLRYGVQPAAHLLRAVRLYVESGPDAPVGTVVDGYLAGAGSLADLAVAAAAAEEASSALAQGVPVDTPRWCCTPDDLFAEVASSVQGRDADGRGTAWVLSGLAMFMRAATGRSDLGAALGPWLARVPLPAVDVGASSGRLAGELGAIGRDLFRCPDARREFALRLLAEFPSARDVVSAALDEAGFLEVGVQ